MPGGRKSNVRMSCLRDGTRSGLAGKTFILFIFIKKIIQNCWQLKLEPLNVVCATFFVCLAMTTLKTLRRQVWIPAAKY